MKEYGWGLIQHISLLNSALEKDEYFSKPPAPTAVSPSRVRLKPDGTW